MEENKLEDDPKEIEQETCPECHGTNLVVTGHCITCLDCGFSLCAL